MYIEHSRRHVVSFAGVLLRDQRLDLDGRDRRGGGGAGGWHLQVLPLPRQVRQDGRPQGQGEDCKCLLFLHLEDDFQSQQLFILKIGKLT